MNISLKAIGANFINLLSNLAITNKPQKQNRKSLAIIRLDAIGDYFLFRPCIEYIYKYFKDYEITLIGNSAWKDLAENLDKEYIKHFIWINTKYFNKNLLYRVKILREIHNKHYNIALSPIYSRYIWRDDAVMKIVSADRKTGFTGKPENCSKSRIKLANTYYTDLIESDPDVIFEADRNIEFVSKFLNKKIFNINNTIHIPNNNFNLPEKYVVISTGASADFRKWNIKKFATIANWLSKQGFDIILCGSKSEEKDVELFKKEFNGNFINLINKTTLIQYLSVLNNAKILISNESSSPHFSMALKTEIVIVISNGNNFIRFNPYSDRKYHIIYHPYIEQKLKEKNGINELKIKFSSGSILNINEISTERVINELKECLNVSSSN